VREGPRPSPSEEKEKSAPMQKSVVKVHSIINDQDTDDSQNTVYFVIIILFQKTAVNVYAETGYNSTIQWRCLQLFNFAPRHLRYITTVLL